MYIILYVLYNDYDVFTPIHYNVMTLYQDIITKWLYYIFVKYEIINLMILMS